MIILTGRLLLQEVRKGFTWGQVTIVPLLDEEEEDASAASSQNYTLPVRPDDKLVIPFQNENLYAYIESADGDKTVGTPTFHSLVRAFEFGPSQNKLRPSNCLSDVGRRLYI